MQWQYSLILGLALALAACGQKEAGSNNSRDNSASPVLTKGNSSRSEGEKYFQVRGVLKKADPGEGTATIQHEEIPGYMAAMTMPFEVKNTNELSGLQPGDVISFRLVVTSDDSWIDQIQKSGVARQNPAPTRESVRLVRDVEPLEIGDVAPDYPFTNELGQAVSLHDFRGKALALTFIFTRCPLPDFCPAMSKKFSETYKILTTTANAPTNWHLLSISFDPHFDKPAVLRAYAHSYNYDPARWSFVTGAMIEIDAITEQFDLPIFKQGENWDHKLRTVVIDAQGRMQKVFVYNQWTPEQLAEELVKAAQAPAAP